MHKGLKLLSTLAFTLAAGHLAALAEPLKIGIEERGFIENGGNSSSYSYPAPQMVPTMDSVRPPQKLQGNAQQQRLPQQRPMQAQVQQSVELPQGFMGAWRVQGQRTNVTAQPQYQAGIGGLFAPSTSNIWNIGGNAKQGYTLTTDQGVSTSLQVHKVAGSRAFILYQHPISKTMAKEAIVMELQNGGASFAGLERISIVKQGEPGERAKVTYQLAGQRQ